MKIRLLLLSAFCFLFFVCQAQTNTGNQNLGINLSFSSNTSTTTFTNPAYTPSSLTTTTKQTSYSLAPAYSYFISKDLDLGVAIGGTGSVVNYDYSPTPYTPTKTDYTAYSGTIYLRKYFLYEDKVGIRTGPFVVYQQSTQKNYYPAGSVNNNNPDNTVDTYTAGINFDFVFYPARKLGLAANIGTLGYSYLKTNTADGAGMDETTQKTFNANFLNSNFALSLFFVLGSK